MLKVTITRDKVENDDDGRPGKLVVPGLFECYTMELPRRVDANGKRISSRSCIAAGTYRCSWFKSPTRTNLNGSPEYLYKLENVADAEGVLIHSGNFAGDVDKDRVSDSEGCILLGAALLELEIQEAKRVKHNVRRTKQLGVSSSRDTLKTFHDLMEKKPFELNIKEAA